MKIFFKFVSRGMKIIPWLTVWTAERAFYIFPKFLRYLVNNYTSGRIQACVVGGELPFIPDLKGGDAILFYPLPQCVRYEIQDYPEITPIPLFDGKILAMIIPKEQRSHEYHAYGYDEEGKRFGSGTMSSHSMEGVTKIRKGVRIDQNRILWDVKSRPYLTSFLMIHTKGKPHAAGYSQTQHWNYPDTTYLPHLVIPPDGTPLNQADVSVMALVINTDAWVSEILVQ